MGILLPKWRKEGKRERKWRFCSRLACDVVRGEEKKSLQVAAEEAPEELGDAVEGRPEDLAGIVLEVAECAAVLAAEAGEHRLALAADVAGVEDAEVTHLDHVVDELGAAFHVGLAEEVLVLKAEVEAEGEHGGGGEAAHAKALQRLHGAAALSRRQLPQHIVVVHHLPEAQPAA